MSKKPGLFAEVQSLREERRSGGRGARRKGVKSHELQELVGEVRPEDGLDPRYDAKRRRHSPGLGRPGLSHSFHKHEQLEGQVQSAISTALQCAASPILNRLTVRAVVRQKAVLMVIAEPRDPTDLVDLIEAAAALEKAVPMLRREVAAAITRKEVPQLSFIVLPVGVQKIED